MFKVIVGALSIFISLLQRIEAKKQMQAMRLYDKSVALAKVASRTQVEAKTAGALAGNIEGLLK